MRLVFTVNGGMADECKIFHSRLASLLSNKRGVKKSPVTTWIKKIKYDVWYYVYVDPACPPQEIKNKFSFISRDFLGISVLISTVYLGGNEGWEKCTSQPGLRSFLQTFVLKILCTIFGRPYRFNGRKIVGARILQWYWIRKKLYLNNETG